MPSTISTSVSSALASSTVMTPSLPTFCIASAIILPTFASPFDEMVPTWATSAEDATFFERFLMSSTTAATAISMPRLRSIGFMPAATDFAPSLTIDAASTVAVVVPSPARSLVFCATSRTICAPMFSNLSSSSISLATVTPSLVIRGAPNDLSSTTLRPFGPSVTRTAWASVSMPCNILSRASTENFTSLAAISVFLWLGLISKHDRRPSPSDEDYRSDILIRPSSWPPRRPSERGFGARSGGRFLGRGLDQHPHDVALLHDEEFDAIDFDLGSRPFAEQDAVADLDVDRDELAALVTAARPHGNDPALLRLLLSGVGNDDAAGALRLGLDTFDDNTVVKWTEFHWYSPVQSL